MKEEHILCLMDYLDHPEDPARQAAVQRLVAEGELSEEELAQWTKTYHQAGEWSHPTPSDQLRANVYDMIRQETSRPSRLSLSPVAWFQRFSVPQLAGATLMLLLGVALGFWLRPAPTYDTQLATLSSEVQRMREMMILTLLEQPSATQRLKAVSISTELSQTDEKIYQALLKTLNHDPQVNVRLAALDALVDYADQPLVRQGLIEAIPQQESPLVQITLAEMMVQLQEKRSVDELRTLLEQQSLNEAAEQEIKKSIQQLI